MVLGSDQMDVSSCDTIKPNPGWDPDKFMYYVRNPNYDQATDDNRLNYIDGFALTINTNPDDLYNRVINGDTDIAHGPPPAAILQQFLTNPDLQDSLKVEPGDRTWYIAMNLLTPPFDDVHVRKAVNLVVDKAALLQGTGGPSSGEVATTISPPSVLPDTATYDPYPSPDFAGDVNAAKAEMAQSKYDSDGDGVCDAPECSDVLMVNRNYEPWTNYTPIMQQSLEQIGISLKIRELEVGTSYTTIQTVSNLVPISINAGWGKDYASPFGFVVPPLHCQRGVHGTSNYSNVGMTEDMAQECGPEVLAAWNNGDRQRGQPDAGVNDDMDNCVATPPGDAYNACWAASNASSWRTSCRGFPYRWGARNVELADFDRPWEYDQSAGATAYCRVAVDNGLTMDEVAQI